MNRCPQCTSMFCGPWACRFTGHTNEAWKRMLDASHYANYHNKRDREVPQWEREARTGGRDPEIY